MEFRGRAADLPRQHSPCHPATLPVGCFFMCLSWHALTWSSGGRARSRSSTRSGRVATASGRRSCRSTSVRTTPRTKTRVGARLHIACIPSPCNMSFGHSNLCIRWPILARLGSLNPPNDRTNGGHYRQCVRVYLMHELRFDRTDGSEVWWS